VIDEYDAKMPFKFAGTIEKIEIKLGPDQLRPQQRGELEQIKKDFALGFGKRLHFRSAKKAKDEGQQHRDDDRRHDREINANISIGGRSLAR
jgi:hypothetical protein